MIINLNEVSKKYGRSIIFQSITAQFESNQTYAIIGKNGSGKSTFLKIIAGLQSPSNGEILWRDNNLKIIKKENWYHHISFCAPSMEIIEEFTLIEFLQFHFRFKKLLNGFSIQKVIDYLEMEHCKNQKIVEYSSGMKQRVKLAQAFFVESDLLILDEPTSNLDEYWIAKYQEWLTDFVNNRIVLIASNELREYSSAHHHIRMNDYKK